MYVCMYLCVCVCMYVRMYVCTYVCMYVCVFFRHYSFFRVPLNGLVRTPGGTRTPGWESLTETNRNFLSFVE